jgi:tetratricopeptide (TPR) repeat protein
MMMRRQDDIGFGSSPDPLIQDDRPRRGTNTGCIRLAGFLLLLPIAAVITFYLVAPVAFHTLTGHVFRAVGNPSSALAAYERALRAEPDNLSTVETLGDFLMDEDEWDAAFTMVQQSAIGNVEQAMLLTQGGVRLRERDPIQTRRWLDAAIATHPEYAPALAERARLAEAEGDRAQAISDYAAAVASNARLTQDGEPILLIVGDLHLREQQLDEAFAYFDQAADLRLLESGFYEARGEFFFRYIDGNYALAEAYYDRAIEREPQNTTLYFNRAWSRYEQEDYAGTREDYSAVIELEPENGAAYHNRALAWADDEAYREALADYRLAFRYLDEDPCNYQNRGAAYQGADDYRRAEQDFREAIDLEAVESNCPAYDPAESYLLLADLYYEMERWADAQEQYTAYLEREEFPEEETLARIDEVAERLRAN